MSISHLTRRRISQQLVALGLSGCIHSAGSDASRTGERIGGVEVGLAMPNLTLGGLGHKALSVRALRGQVVLLDVWASWCEPCKVELPMLDDIAQRMRGKDLVVLAVSIDQEESNVRQFLATRRRWSIRFFHDPAGWVAERLAPPKMPSSYVIDRQGVVRMVNAGFQLADAARIERQLLTLCAT